MKNLKLLIPYLRPYRRNLYTGLFFVLATAAIGLLSPLVIGLAIDSLREDVSPRSLMFYALIMIGISLVRGICQYFHRIILVAMSRRIEFDMGNELFAHLERMHQGFFQKSRTGDIMARATNDLAAVRMICGPAIMYSGNTVFAGIGALAFMFSIHVELTLVAISVMPFLAWATRYFGKRIHVLFNDVQAKFSDISVKVQENLAGARVVRAYVREDTEEEIFEELNANYVESNRHLIRWSATFSPLLQTLLGLSMAAVLWYGGRLLIAGEMTVGDFVAFTLFLTLLTWPMIAIGWVINLVERGTASLVRIRQILDEEPAIRDEAPLIENVDLRGAIQFRALDFAYAKEEEPVLHGIDLEIEKGQTVAVVGRTGSGKSTLLSLIPRLIDPPEGHLEIDGVEIRRLPLADLRQAIAMVPQETLLFSTSIRDNITFGKPDATEEEVARFASLAGLDLDLESFPDGLDTVVGGARHHPLGRPETTRGSGPGHHSQPPDPAARRLPLRRRHRNRRAHLEQPARGSARAYGALGLPPGFDRSAGGLDPGPRPGSGGREGHPRQALGRGRDLCRPLPPPAARRAAGRGLAG